MIADPVAAGPSPACSPHGVDVGAGLPVAIGNFYHFEQNGWRAVCIEPNAYLA